MKINNTLYPLLFSYSKKVYEKTYTLTDASKVLAEQHGMNVNSARDYINNFKQLMRGERFKRTLSASSMKYFIDQIYEDYGAEQLIKAVKALELHIHYYESCHAGEMNKLRSLLRELSSDFTIEGVLQPNQR